jgi:hypothetical protein
MSPSKNKDVPSYEEFEAVNLFCPTCRRALPVRKHLLLVLPDGDLYEYRCARCNTLVGKKKGDSSLHVGTILPEI